MAAIVEIKVAGDLASDDVEAVRVLPQAYVDAWLSGDPEAVMRLFTEDAVIIPHHGVTPREGAAAMRQFWWRPDAPPSGINTFEMWLNEIGGHGWLAYARGGFELRYWYMDGETRHEVTNKGNSLMLLRRASDGVLRISHHMWGDPQ